MNLIEYILIISALSSSISELLLRSLLAWQSIISIYTTFPKELHLVCAAVSAADGITNV